MTIRVAVGLILCAMNGHGTSLLLVTPQHMCTRYICSSRVSSSIWQYWIESFECATFIIDCGLVVVVEREKMGGGRNVIGAHLRVTPIQMVKCHHSSRDLSCTRVKATYDS